MNKEKKLKSVDGPMDKLQVGSVIYTTRLTRKFVNRPFWRRPDEHKIEAFIPGTIREILVKEGQEVEAGTPLLILEAMKMRNEVVAPLPGIIRKIHVRSGDMVPKLKLLVEVAT